MYAINPKAVSRYRDRHAVSGAKSDSGDAKVLADLVRTDRHNHRRVAGDSSLAQAITVTARAHQNLVWTRQRQVNQLRQALRAYYPGALNAFGTDLAHPEALAVLSKAPSPELGRATSRPPRPPNHHDVRDLLRNFTHLPGEITTTDDGTIVVTLDLPDTPIHRRALHGLVDDLNTHGATYPGTNIPVTYQVAVHHSEATA